MTSERTHPRTVARTAIRAAAVLTVVGFLVLIAYGLAAQSPDTTLDDALKAGEPASAPGFELDVLQLGEIPAAVSEPVARAVSDGRIALAELRGTAVVLNFWASWCAPCREEAPRLERAWRTAGPQGVVFLGLDQQDVTDDARAFLREFEVTYPNVHEAGKETSRRYGLTGLPETYFISARGNVVAHVIGAVNEEQLRSGIDAARSGTPQRLGSGGDRRPTR